MAAPRSTSIRALRLLAKQHAPEPSALASMAPFRRSLHITGAFSAQPARGPDVNAIYRSRTLGDLLAECERRNLRPGGTKAELVDRLANHDILQSRAFSIAMRKIDSRTVDSKSPTRSFNTSRAHKAVNDNSTIDFAYMPQGIDFPLSSATNDTPIPILPDAFSHYQLISNDNDSNGRNPMKPQIYNVSGDGAEVSPMSEVVDNHAVEFDPFELTETVRRARGNMGDAGGIEGTEGTKDGTVSGVARQLWEGIVEDLLGKSIGSGGGQGLEGRKKVGGW
ncbi:hypothetical protein ACO22_05356 [Paracoccidioides brasiliensis]|uniref:Uncharacterized protein n=1 Tax=Paracoccidioides brasiliensis TaxID=121759 RepID=A0A1D2JAP5_PARBR|nr:hypothetical protein ACO22_05356 [Paracoccidioides brasiliensis]ODH47491.1 hypothetical protein GX48_06405 [Paracoccidioides brasiliensis]